MTRQRELLAAYCQAVDAALAEHGLSARVTGGCLDPAAGRVTLAAEVGGELAGDLAGALGVARARAWLLIEVRQAGNVEVDDGTI